MKQQKTIFKTESTRVFCIDCRNLMFSDCYGECRKGYRGIVNPHDTCEHAQRKKKNGK